MGVEDFISQSDLAPIWNRRCGIVPKICQEYQNVSKDIEIHRNPGVFENAHFTQNIHYYLQLSFFRRFLHTVEVRGSSPLSPTIPLAEMTIVLQPCL
jgi:hypothetical protein